MRITESTCSVTIDLTDIAVENSGNSLDGTVILNIVCPDHAVAYAVIESIVEAIDDDTEPYGDDPEASL